MNRKPSQSPRRKYPWDEIDPQIFSKKTSLANLAKAYDVPYRQVTNRKYNLRDKIQKLHESGDEKKLKKLLRHLKVKDVSSIQMLNAS